MSYYRVATANSYDATISRITQRTAELASAQEKLSAAKRVLRATDDPVAATLAERESNRLMRTEADLRALERSRSALQQAESTLGDMNDVLGRFKELLVQGGNAALAATDRRSISQEMRGLRDQLLNLANTQDTEGNALLGGLGTVSTHGRAFADVYGVPSGVQFQAIGGQAAATEGGLPNRVDGQFALMRNLTGDGTFVATPGSGTVLLKEARVTDPAALQASGFLGDVPAAGDPPRTFDLRVEVTPAGALSLNVYRSDDPNGDGSPAHTVALGNATPGQTVDLRQVLGADTVPITGNGITPAAIDQGFSIRLEGVVKVPTPLPGATAALSSATLSASEPGDLFASLQRAIDALESTTLNSTGRTQELGRVHEEFKTGQDRLLLVQGRLGEWLRRGDSLESQLQDRAVAGEQEISNLTDLDMVKGLSDFKTQQLGLQAALQSYGQVQRLSLFQYIA